MQDGFNGIAEDIWQAVMALGVPSLAGFSVEILPEVGSTNTELMRRARAGRCEPTLLVALTQTAGRGRLGRSWASQAGDSLTFSLGLALSPQSWEGLSLAVGVSVAQSLDSAIEATRLPADGNKGEAIGLKWPNDLWWQERKLAGILIETASPGEPLPNAAAVSARYAVVGVGINVAMPAAGLDGISPACLQERWPQASAALALKALAAPLLRDVMAFERAGFAAFAARFAARDALRGRAVWAGTGLGQSMNAFQGDSQHIEGVAQGVDASGALLVHTSAGTQRVHSAQVSVRPVLPACAKSLLA